MSTVQDFQIRLQQAQDLLAQGQSQSALHAFESLLLSQTSPTGDHPPTRVLVLDGLGRTLHALGKLEEAEARFAEALVLLEKIFGPAHPHMAGGLQNLARIRTARGYAKEACELGKKALLLLRQSVGEGHPRVADALLNLSSSYYDCEEYELAEAYLRQARDIWERLVGADSVEVSTCLNNLGRLYEQRGDPAQGALLHEQAVNIRRRLLGDHPETAFSLGNWGAALVDAKQYPKAKAALTEALECYARLGLSEAEGARACRKNLELCGKA